MTWVQQIFADKIRANQHNQRYQCSIFFKINPKHQSYNIQLSPIITTFVFNNITMREKLIEWLESHMGSCYWQKYLGIRCPGCGMQRAFIELLKGNLWESIKIYPALLPTMFLLTYLVLHIIFKFKKGAYVLKITFIFTVVLIIGNYVFKLIYE